jgi:hypothetical protein
LAKNPGIHANDHYIYKALSKVVWGLFNFLDVSLAQKRGNKLADQKEELKGQYSLLFTYLFTHLTHVSV